MPEGSVRVRSCRSGSGAANAFTRMHKTRITVEIDSLVRICIGVGINALKVMFRVMLRCDRCMLYWRYIYVHTASDRNKVPPRLTKALLGAPPSGVPSTGFRTKILLMATSTVWTNHRCSVILEGVRPDMKWFASQAG